VGLEYHLNRQIVFNSESEYKSLYSWSLQELDEEKRPIGRPQIPWEWSVHFASVDLSVQQSWKVEAGYDLKNKKALPPALGSDHQIVAKLVSGRITDGVFEHGPSYSMFGTDRTLKEISLVILSDDDIEDEKRIMAWGSPSYEGGIDFHPETTPDVMMFYFSLPATDFGVLRDAVKATEISALMLRLSNVSGFYSDWSPDIITGEIKVLTDPKDQNIELPVEFSSLKLNYSNIEKASLSAISAHKTDYVLESIHRLREREQAWLNDDPDTNEDDLSLALPKPDEQTMALIAINAKLGTVNIALWVIAILIIAMILLN
jgi:hypothetical protein